MTTAFVIFSAIAAMAAVVVAVVAVVAARRLTRLAARVEHTLDHDVEPALAQLRQTLTTANAAGADLRQRMHTVDRIARRVDEVLSVFELAHVATSVLKPSAAAMSSWWAGLRAAVGTLSAKSREEQLHDNE
jgi:uncharacterized protein YoxC